MLHIIKGNPERTERAAMKAALNQHQAKYGDYGPTKKGVTYTIKVIEGLGECSVSEFASNTPLEHKDRWQTPIEIFNALDLEFAFYLDAAASRQNTLCQSWIDESQDALNRDWDTCGAIWCNPPYSNITPWVQKAAEQCREQNQTVVMLLPADTSTGWFSLALQTVDEVRLITGGRLSFINAGTGKPGKNGNSKGSLLFIWRPFIKPRCQFTTVSRDELIAIGSSIMAGVKAA